jgi:predicted transcriptional regulator
MPSQHKTTPLSIRLPDAERQRLYDYAERTGQPVRRVIIDAVREKLDREGGGAERADQAQSAHKPTQPCTDSFS